ncbi:hypothetical protein J26TS2_22890 [Shouchella clausii]|nr:hypothetical protein J26TS2_22890 [Shouchella clausii]
MSMPNSSSTSVGEAVSVKRPHIQQTSFLTSISLFAYSIDKPTYQVDKLGIFRSVRPYICKKRLAA